MVELLQPITFGLALPAQICAGVRASPKRASSNISYLKCQGAMMQVGIHSFAVIFPDPVTGVLPSAADCMAGVLEEIEAAERVGLDLFGIGEHHRAEFLDSAPAVILAAAAARISRIRLTS